MPVKFEMLLLTPNSQAPSQVQFGDSSKIGSMQKHEDFAAELAEGQGTGG
jgi:hypothetical protein